MMVLQVRSFMMRKIQVRLENVGVLDGSQKTQVKLSIIAVLLYGVLHIVMV